MDVVETDLESKGLDVQWRYHGLERHCTNSSSIWNRFSCSYSSSVCNVVLETAGDGEGADEFAWLMAVDVAVKRVCFECGCNEE